jgi:hypothetical protein
MTTAAIEQALRAPIGTFTDEVTDDRGRVNVRTLAQALDLPMTTIAPALGLSPRWLNENPTGTKVQPKAVMLLEIANELAAALGGKKYVVLYLKSAQPDFNGETPADQLKDGRLAFLRGYVNEVVTLRPD